MTLSLSPQDIQELAAGYVLGDLDSDEVEVFQTLLAASPELYQDVADLQEALSLMPYGLADVEVDSAVRSHLLTQAQAELSPERSTEFIPIPLSQPSELERARPRRVPGGRRLPWVVSTVAASLAIVGGLATLRLSGQVRFLQVQSERMTNPASSHQTSVVHSWSGLDDILQDHQTSLNHPDGPVDFVVGRPDDILDLLNGFQTTVAALPLLPQGRLLGGSNCQFGKTQGVRLTYQLSADQTLSAYQLDITDQDGPTLQADQVTLQRPDGTGVVLWRDDNYLYALVATLPMAELQTLAHTMNGT